MLNLDTQRWARLSPLLDELLDLEDAARAARLEQLCHSDAALAGELAALLAEQAAIDREAFLEGAALDNTMPQASLAGHTIGAYTLERPIGAGGMGSVWLARRSDGRYEGQVAVKLLNLALVARGGAERFAREGSVLARLAHPNIARLLDAGVSAGGQPYLVLEYIEGEPIDRWCDARRLGLRARIGVLLEVLAAVAHAHSNLVLHRDLKPSNILVTGDGQVKLLDFGIAKLIAAEQQTSPVTELTEIAGRAFTPDFAAPEQVQGNDATTATDVYALGVLMYVLLGGGHPTTRAQATPVERLRAVIEVEPARLSDAAARAGDETALLRGGQTAQKLARDLRGDLDNIVAKALKKAPVERYATADALADDLRRWLAHEPVAAHADTLGYRVGKFVRRHRASVLTAGAVAFALLASSTVALWQMVEANQQRRLAEDEAARSASTQEFLQFVLTDAGASGRPFTTAELLARAERSVEAQHGSGEGKLAVEQLITLGQLHSTLSEHKKSLELLETAHRRASSAGYAELRRQAACDLARQRLYADQLDEASRLLDQTIAELRVQQPDARALVDCLLNKADVELTKDNIAAGVAAAQEAVALAQKTVRGSQTAQISARMALAIAYRVAGERKLADTTYRGIDALLQRSGRERTTDAMVLYANWGRLKADTGDIAGAARLIESAIEIGQALRPDGKPDHVFSVSYAQRLSALARLDEAEALFSRARTLANAQGDALYEGRALLGLVSVQRERGALAAAGLALVAAREFIEPRFPAQDPSRTALLLETGWLHLAGRSYEPATAVLSEVVARNAATKARPPLHAQALALLALAELGQGLHERAAAHAAEAVALASALALPDEPSYWVGHCLLAQSQVERALGREATARELAARASAQLGPTVGADHPLTLQAREFARE